MPSTPSRLSSRNGQDLPYVLFAEASGISPGPPRRFGASAGLSRFGGTPLPEDASTRRTTHAGSWKPPRRAKMRLHIRKRQEGQALVEFTIVATLLILLLLGIAQFGIVWNNYVSVT